MNNLLRLSRHACVCARMDVRIQGVQGSGGKLTSGVMGLLTGPHQISFSELGSWTIRLSEGERPVFAPE